MFPGTRRKRLFISINSLTIKGGCSHMPEPREATTEHLSYVIRAMLLAHQTGMLRVERTYGNTTEGGTVVFINGQIVQASAGSFRGMEALNRLSGWGFCRFVFIPTSVAELTHMNHLLPASTSASSPPPPTPPARNTPPPSYHPANDGYKADTGPLPPVTRPLPAAVTRQLPVVTSQLSPIKTPAPEPTGVPYRLQEGPAALRYIEQRKLSRAHRRLFLLIDGKRSAPDLAHLIGKAPEEVYRLLYDLEQTGLIQR
jgi:hypothetical protein